MAKKLRPRALVVGLDGVPYSLLVDLIEEGCIPNMASIFKHGYFGQMSVSLPEISSVSWSSFMTGRQSGEHAIFGFLDLEPGSYRMYFPNFTDLAAGTLWDELANHEKKTVVINMPATYPAREINGVMISGFVAVDLKKSVYPYSYLHSLVELGYRIDIDTGKARNDHDFLLKDLEETLSIRSRAVELLWKEVDWDLFVVVVTGTDRLMHFLWEAYENKDHPYHQPFLDYFSKVDRFVGRLYDKFMTLDGSKDGRNSFYMLSDHGFTGIETEVYLNRWLQENGYLKFRRSEPETINDIGPSSTAFALDPSRIYVNLKGKYPLGTVDAIDYERLRRELKEGLEDLTYIDGKRVAKKIFFKEELYRGPHLVRAPDLVVLANHGYDLKGKVNGKTVFSRTNLSGMHTQEDAFYFSSILTPCTSIFDAKRIILRSLCASC